MIKGSEQKCPEPVFYGLPKGCQFYLFENMLRLSKIIVNLPNPPILRQKQAKK